MGSAKIHGKGNEFEVAKTMGDAGWTQDGSGRWSKKILGAAAMLEIPVVSFKRRTVSALGSGHLVEDLWYSRSAPERLLRRAFQFPRDLMVEVELGEIEGDGAEVPWEDRPMSSADATSYRAVVARLIFYQWIEPTSSTRRKRRLEKWRNPRTRIVLW